MTPTTMTRRVYHAASLFLFFPLAGMAQCFSQCTLGSTPANTLKPGTVRVWVDPALPPEQFNAAVAAVQSWNGATSWVSFTVNTDRSTSPTTPPSDAVIGVKQGTPPAPPGSTETPCANYSFQRDSQGNIARADLFLDPSVVQAGGRSVQFGVAHEIGHMLGSPDTDCQDRSSTVMQDGFPCALPEEARVTPAQCDKDKVSQFYASRVNPAQNYQYYYYGQCYDVYLVTSYYWCTSGGCTHMYSTWQYLGTQCCFLGICG